MTSEPKIDTAKYIKRHTVHPKIQARIAFKRWKNGLPVTEYDKWLISKWYPFVNMGVI